MTYPCFIVDAFVTDRPFSGNPAAIVLLESPADEAWMQSVAAQFNLSETAFLVPEGDCQWNLRWFTPAVEVDLCGHATLAATRALAETAASSCRQFAFTTRSGLLTTRLEGESIDMDFPAITPVVPDNPPALPEGLASAVDVCEVGPDLLLRLASENEVRRFVPDVDALKSLSERGVIITAAGSGDTDFVSRFFAPNAGIDEDPVTGSAHCALAIYWAGILGKQQLTAEQCSPRGGRVAMTLDRDRVTLAGQASIFMRGQVPEQSVV